MHMVHTQIHIAHTNVLVKHTKSKMNKSNKMFERGGYLVACVLYSSVARDRIGGTWRNLLHQPDNCSLRARSSHLGRVLAMHCPPGMQAADNSGGKPGARGGYRESGKVY